MSTQVTTTARNNRTLIDGPAFKEQLKKVLPRLLPPDRFIRVALTAGMKNPKILDCTPESLFLSLLQAAQMGLEVGRDAHLVPYGTTCTLLPDYKGKVKLALECGAALSVHADVVRANDIFEHDMGEVKRHTYRLGDDRGDVIGAYVIITLKGGGKKSEVMSKQEIEDVRKRSRAGSSGPWVSDWNEMAKKTVFHRASKWIPLSPEARDAFDFEEQSVVTPEIKSAVKVVTGKDAEPAPMFEVVDDVPMDASPTEPAPAPQPAPVETVQDRLFAICNDQKCTFDEFVKVCRVNGFVEKDMDSWGGWNEVPTAFAERMVKGKNGLIKGINAIKNEVVM